MPAPTFVQAVETTWTSVTGSTKTTASFSVQTGDILVACMESGDANLSGTLTATGGSLSWTSRQDVNPGLGWCRAVIATATATSNASITVTVTRGVTSGSVAFGVEVHTFRGAT